MTYVEEMARHPSSQNMPDAYKQTTVGCSGNHPQTERPASSKTRTASDWTGGGALQGLWESGPTRMSGAVGQRSYFTPRSASLAGDAGEFLRSRTSTRLKA